MDTETDIKRLRIGVDVGDTNTDGVIIDMSKPKKKVLAWHKEPTTANPTLGINDAIEAMLDSAGANTSDVASLTIGTTHFANAVVTRDAARLTPVAVIRLCGPFPKDLPPCSGWPEGLRKIVLGHYASIKGGLGVDGTLIANVDEDEIKTQCATISEMGIKTVVLNGIFSPINTLECQEQRAAEIIKAAIPGCDVVCSKDVANLGILERENAAILNASLLRFARHVTFSFQKLAKNVGLECPIFITQNDGTALTCEAAAQSPIRTFSTGFTNSMRGAAFLARGESEEPVMVVDIGGTTTYAGILEASGLPRQKAYDELCGIRLNAPSPYVASIVLGGGSIVKREHEISVGPDSVGYRLAGEAIVFGGETLTATDCIVLADHTVKIGFPALVRGKVTSDELGAFKVFVKKKLQSIVHTTKASSSNMPVIIVGGGSIIAPNELEGASKVLKPKWAQVANAVGAAVAQVSAVVDVVRSTEAKTPSELLDETVQEALEKAVAAGALRASVNIVGKEALQLQDIANKARFVVRAIGDFDFSRASLVSNSPETDYVEAMDHYDETAENDKEEL